MASFGNLKILEKSLLTKHKKKFIISASKLNKLKIKEKTKNEKL